MSGTQKLRASASACAGGPSMFQSACVGGRGPVHGAPPDQRHVVAWQKSCGLALQALLPFFRSSKPVLWAHVDVGITHYDSVVAATTCSVVKCHNLCSSSRYNGDIGEHQHCQAVAVNMSWMSPALQDLCIIDYVLACNENECLDCQRSSRMKKLLRGFDVMHGANLLNDAIHMHCTVRTKRMTMRLLNKLMRTKRRKRLMW
eukprot:516073-Amphidinium_carterae.1